MTNQTESNLPERSINVRWFQLVPVPVLEHFAPCHSTVRKRKTVTVCIYDKIKTELLVNTCACLLATLLQTLCKLNV